MGDIKVRPLNKTSCGRELFRILVELVLFICVVVCGILCVGVFAALNNDVIDATIQSDACILFADDLVVLSEDDICSSVIWLESIVVVIAGLFVLLLGLKAILVLGGGK